MIVHVCSQDLSTSLNARCAHARDCSVSHLTCHVSMQVKIRMVLGPQHSIRADRTSRYLSGLLDDGHFSEPCDGASDGVQLTDPFLSFRHLLSSSITLSCR